MFEQASHLGIDVDPHLRYGADWLMIPGPPAGSTVACLLQARGSRGMPGPSDRLVRLSGMADKLGLSTGEVVVKDNNLEKALKRLKRKLERAGLFKEMKRRRHYEKPSERKRRKKQEAERRRRKKIRKDLEVA